MTRLFFPLLILNLVLALLANRKMLTFFAKLQMNSQYRGFTTEEEYVTQFRRAVLIFGIVVNAMVIAANW